MIFRRVFNDMKIIMDQDLCKIQKQLPKVCAPSYSGLNRIPTISSVTKKDARFNHKHSTKVLKYRQGFAKASNR